MKQSRPFSARREIFPSAKWLVTLLSISFSILFILQPGNAADQANENLWQSKDAVKVSNGIVYDGITDRSKARQSVDVCADLPYKYFGNSFSGKFHRPWCPYSQAMNVDHAVPFNFRWQAIKSGYSPCNFCLPQQWKSVHCILLKPATSQ